MDEHRAYYLCPMFDPGSRELEDPTYKFYMVPTEVDCYGGNFSNRKVRHPQVLDVLPAGMFPRARYTSRSTSGKARPVPQMIPERPLLRRGVRQRISMLLGSKRLRHGGGCQKMAGEPRMGRKFLKTARSTRTTGAFASYPHNSNASRWTLSSECMPLTTAQYGILCAEVDIPSPKFMMAQLTGFATAETTR